MSIIWTILIGFIVGLLAKFVMPGRDPGGFFITAAIGIAGSLIATYGGKALGIYGGERDGGLHRRVHRRDHPPRPLPVADARSQHVMSRLNKESTWHSTSETCCRNT